MQRFLKMMGSCVAALILQSGSVYAQSTAIEVYKSPT